ncbi:MAG: hypothetical protein EXS15_05965 [Phycisphaerales bacterium]|nr:hypothetical protein [Phycisphaerales bacterium]
MQTATPTDERLSIATEAILAGLAALRVTMRHPRAREPHIKPDGTPVTAGDLAVQMAVCSVLAQRTPSLSIVGEEGESSFLGTAGAELLARALVAVRESMGSAAPADPVQFLRGDNRPTGDSWWTVDPIDGTKGFRSARHYALCLALVENRQPTVGVLSCPTLVMGRDPLEVGNDEQFGTVYAALRGCGAWKFQPCDQSRTLPRTALRVHRPKHTGESWRVCDSIEGGSRAERMRSVMASTDLKWSSVSLDSQCKYALVAEGAADCFMRVPAAHGAEKVWDHAPGVVVAEEAGAVISDVLGKPLIFAGESLNLNAGTLACDIAIAALVHAAAAKSLPHAPVAP